MAFRYGLVGMARQAGLMQGISQGINQFNEVYSARQKIKRDQEKWKLDKRISNLQLKKLEDEVSPESLAMARKERDVDFRQSEADLAKTEIELRRLEKGLKMGIGGMFEELSEVNRQLEETMPGYRATMRFDPITGTAKYQLKPKKEERAAVARRLTPNKAAEILVDQDSPAWLKDTAAGVFADISGKSKEDILSEVGAEKDGFLKWVAKAIAPGVKLAVGALQAPRPGMARLAKEGAVEIARRLGMTSPEAVAKAGQPIGTTGMRRVIMIDPDTGVTKPISENMIPEALKRGLKVHVAAAS